MPPRVRVARGVVYHNDVLAKERESLACAERLLLHQADSGPVMEELHAWLGRQFDEHRVEPGRPWVLALLTCVGIGRN